MAFLHVQEWVNICPQTFFFLFCSMFPWLWSGIGCCLHLFRQSHAVDAHMSLVAIQESFANWNRTFNEMYALRGLQQYRNMMVHSWSSFYVAISLHPRQLKPKGNPIEKFCLKKAIDKPLEYHQTSRNIEVLITLSHSTSQPVFWPAPVRSWFKRRVFAGGTMMRCKSVSSTWRTALGAPLVWRLLPTQEGELHKHLCHFHVRWVWSFTMALKRLNWLKDWLQGWGTCM